MDSSNPNTLAHYKDGSLGYMYTLQWVGEQFQVHHLELWESHYRPETGEEIDHTVKVVFPIPTGPGGAVSTKLIATSNGNLAFTDLIGDTTWGQFWNSTQLAGLPTGHYSVYLDGAGQLCFHFWSLETGDHLKCKPLLDTLLCLNGGMVTNGLCSCPSGYTGTRCEISP
jgi:hypothetical protein